MGRTRKQAPKAKPTADDMTPEDHEALEQAEMDEGGMDEEEAPEEEEAPPAPAGPKAKNLMVDEKRVKLPRRNLAGAYRCKARVSHGGMKQMPGTVITLSDEEARHFLKDGVVEAVED